MTAQICVQIFVVSGPVPPYRKYRKWRLVAAMHKSKVIAIETATVYMTLQILRTKRRVCL